MIVLVALDSVIPGTENGVVRQQPAYLEVACMQTLTLPEPLAPNRNKGTHPIRPHTFDRSFVRSFRARSTRPTLICNGVERSASRIFSLAGREGRKGGVVVKQSSLSYSVYIHSLE
jgi:hypothetical protein